MGNSCVGSRFSKNVLVESVPASLWRTRGHDEVVSQGKNGVAATESSPAPQSKKPEPVWIPETKPKPKPSKHPEAEVKPVSNQPPQKAPRKPHHLRRGSSAGLQVGSVLKHKTDNLKDIYSLGRKLGQGQFGTTHLCVEKTTAKEYACKSILKRKLTAEEDVEDVRREIQIMHHLSDHPNVISIKGAYEDAVAVHVVMELCAGGELFDRIIQKGHFTERRAAELARVIVGVVQACHSLGVMHRDLKPENFMYVNQSEEALLKKIDFGLSTFFRPEADVDNSGTIDYGEFIAATLHLNKIEQEEHLFAAFSYFDKDGTGYVSRDELQHACEEFGLQNIRWEDIIQEVDEDNDGRIDYNEFVVLMQMGNGFYK